MRTSLVQLSWITILPVLTLLELALASDDPHFKAVYSFDNMIIFYERLRHKKLPPDADKQPEIKKRICEEITHSQYFRSNGYNHIDPESNPWFKQLKSVKHSEIFRKLFKKGTINWKKPIELVTGNYSYQNLYMSKEIHFDEVNVLLDEPVDDRPPTPGRRDALDVSALGKNPVYDVEHLFLCLTRRANAQNEFQKWYVSKEYNSRARAKRPQPAIAIRFVFKESESSGKFELEAVATEAALEFIPPQPVAKYYVDEIRKNRPEAAAKAIFDPLCVLIADGYEHYRLCSAIMNSDYFVSITEKSNSDNDVEHSCLDMEVVLPPDYSYDKTYSEWMAVCKVQSTRTGNETFYYFSRAYRDDTVLVYSPTYEGKMSIVKMFTNVAIDDSGAAISPRSRSNSKIQIARPRSNNGRGNGIREDTVNLTRSNSKGSRRGH